MRSLHELRSFRHPPSAICQLLEAVVVLLGFQETTWPAFLGGLLLEPQLWMLGEEELARVHDFRVGRGGLGHVTFHGQTDCRSLLPQLPEILVIKQGEVIVYPDARKKPPVGQGLNKPARIVLHGCMPRVQTRLSTPAARERYRERVAQMTEDKGAIFEDYDCDDGTWTFRVNHF